MSFFIFFLPVFLFSFLVLVHRPYSLDAEDTFTCVSQPTELNVRPANSLPSFHNATII